MATRSTAIKRSTFLTTHVVPATTTAPEDTCNICLEPFSPTGTGTDVRHAPVTFDGPGLCKHVLGACCIEKWPSMPGVNTCAYCRRELFALESAEPVYAGRESTPQWDGGNEHWQRTSDDWDFSDHEHDDDEEFESEEDKRARWAELTRQYLDAQLVQDVESDGEKHAARAS